MGSELVTIGTFPNTMLAVIARNKLEEAGIRSLLHGGEGSSIPINAGFAWVKLQVAEEDLDRALDILEQPDTDDLPNGAFTEKPPELDPEEMEPEIPEEKPNPYMQTAKVTRGPSTRDVVVVCGTIMVAIVLILLRLLRVLAPER